MRQSSRGASTAGRRPESGMGGSPRPPSPGRVGLPGSAHPPRSRTQFAGSPPWGSAPRSQRTHQVLEGVVDGGGVLAHLVGASHPVHTPETLGWPHRLPQVVADHAPVCLLQGLLGTGGPRTPVRARVQPRPARLPLSVAPKHLRQWRDHVPEVVPEGLHPVQEWLQRVLVQPILSAQNLEEGLGTGRWGLLAAS